MCALKSGQFTYDDYEKIANFLTEKIKIRPLKFGQFAYDDYEKIANFLTEKIKIRPKLGIVCGTGLGNLVSLLSNPTSISYDDIPNFPTSTVQGHSGKLVFGILSNTPTVCMQGRFHGYEGYELWETVIPIRVMKLLGISTLIVSNAAGGINSEYKTGDVMLIKDHINFPNLGGQNSLRGPHDDRWGPRFVPMSDAYNCELLKQTHLVAKEMGLDWVHEGVYACVGGPTFETVAEIRALAVLGSDAVGMSTAHEIGAARQCDIKCLGFSLITNLCVSDYKRLDFANHQEVLQVGRDRESDMNKFVGKIVEKFENENLI